MNLFPCFVVLVILLLTSLTTSTALSNAAVRSHVSCPCTVLIAAPHHAPPLNIIVGRTLAQRRLIPSSHSDAIRPDVRFSRRAWMPSHATMRDALFSYHAVRVDIPARISVVVVRAHQVESHPRISTAEPFSVPSQIRLHVASGVERSSQCPVILDPDDSSRGVQTNMRQQDAIQPRIVGGQKADRELAKHLAFIVTPSTQGSRACSGTVVASRLVITAAHCEVDRTSAVYVGGLQGNPSNGILRHVSSVSKPPNFSQANHFRFDIAVVTLDEDIPESAARMKVNINKSVPLDGSVVRAAGYGLRQHDSPNSNIASVLNFVDIPVVPGSTCTRAYTRVEGVDIDYEYQVCAGYFGHGGCDSCQGDSGGPLFQYDDEGDPVLVGVVSIGVKCADPNFPGVYVRTAAHNDFLPNEGIQRTQETEAVFSDFKPSTAFPKQTVILAAAAGAAVIAAVALALCIVRSKRKHRQTQFSNSVTTANPVIAPPSTPSYAQPAVPISPPPVYSGVNLPPPHMNNWPDLPPPNAHFGQEDQASHRWSHYAASAGVPTNIEPSNPQTQANTITTRPTTSTPYESSNPVANGAGNSSLALDTYDPYQTMRALVEDPNAATTNNPTERAVHDSAPTSDRNGGTN